MLSQATSPQQLMLNLTLYFVLLFGGVATIGLVRPDMISLMPLGGTNALEFAAIEFEEKPLTGKSEAVQVTSAKRKPSARQIGLASLFLAVSRLEERSLRHLGLPIGSSLLAVATLRDS